MERKKREGKRRKGEKVIPCLRERMEKFDQRRRRFMPHPARR